MIITKPDPFTKKEIKKLREEFDVYIKTVINIRPSDGNTSNEVQDIEIRKIFEGLTKYFFKEIYE